MERCEVVNTFWFTDRKFAGAGARNVVRNSSPGPDEIADSSARRTLAFTSRHA